MTEPDPSVCVYVGCDVCGTYVQIYMCVRFVIGR